MSILEAADGVSARSAAAAHAGIAAIEVQAPCERTGHGTRPIGAAGADTEERTTAAAAVARHGQFQRGAECAGRVVAGPTVSLSVPLRFGGQTVAGRARVVDSVYTLP